MSIVALLVFAATGQAMSMPSVYWTGGDSKVTVASVALIKDVWPWMRTWMRHTGNTKQLVIWEGIAKDRPEELRYDYYNEISVPLVDFKQNVIIAIFGGRRSGNTGYNVHGLIRDGDVMTLRYSPRYYSTTVSSLSAPNTFIDAPFAFVLLPRNCRAIRLEKGIIEKKGSRITKFQLAREFKL